MVLYNSAVKYLICRRVGMADEADSKSVVGNNVWVQVPSPAVLIKKTIEFVEVSIDLIVFLFINL